MNIRVFRSSVRLMTAKVGVHEPSHRRGHRVKAYAFLVLPIAQLGQREGSRADDVTWQGGAVVVPHLDHELLLLEARAVHPHLQRQRFSAPLRLEVRVHRRGRLVVRPALLERAGRPHAHHRILPPEELHVLQAARGVHGHVQT